MLKYIDSRKNNFKKKLRDVLDKRMDNRDQVSSVVKKIIKDIKKNGDNSILKYKKKFSKIKKINLKEITYSKDEINKTLKKLDNKTKKAIDLAFKRIFAFHKNQKFKTYRIKDKNKNILSYVSSPIEKVGIYVPAGLANYPSSVLMNCIPALIAGVKEIYMTTPSINKKFNPAIIYAAKKCNVKKIYKIGGAQAIASFAYGTKTIKKVDKIVGPGNEYVASAKKEVFGDVGIDMIAGPSEVTILADSQSNPEWIAADLIAQSEHDTKSQSILICDNKKIIKDVNFFLKKQLKKIPKEKIAYLSLKKFGCAIFCVKKNSKIKIINEIAPEHLELYIKKPEGYLKKIKNAGSIFVGKFSPEALGDYLAGPNHVLPTSGAAKFSSGLSVYDFLKRRSVIKISKSGIENLGPSVINLANYEKLEGHANSIKIRLKKGT